MKEPSDFKSRFILLLFSRNSLIEPVGESLGNQLKANFKVESFEIFRILSASDLPF